MHRKDIVILRDLAYEYMDICSAPIQEQRRALWRTHNSLKPTRPLIYVRAFAWHEMPQSHCLCMDYVLSYRPSPADMVSYGSDPDRIQSILRRDLEACKHCHVDITLKGR